MQTLRKLFPLFLSAVAVGLLGCSQSGELRPAAKTPPPSEATSKAKPAPAALKPQATCPVLGGKISKQVYADYQGQRIYFCCANCQKPFKANPEKYFEKFAAEGVLLESVQTKCPVMGTKLNKDMYTDYKGRRVYFCCAACVVTFKKEPAKYLSKL